MVDRRAGGICTPHQVGTSSEVLTSSWLSAVIDIPYKTKANLYTNVVLLLKEGSESIFIKVKCYTYS
jgi:hypothetical protein